MSVINKKPFIQSVIDSLSGAELSDLSDLINGTSTSETLFKSFINTSYILTDDDEGVNRCVFEVSDNLFTGYLIFNDNYCVMITYGTDNTQKLNIITFDSSKRKYEFIPEELSISELRMIVSDKLIAVGEGVTVQAGDIESGTATAGKALIADGDGGASWGDAGTEVVANPTLAGTEAALEGLQVGSTKYKIASGGEVVAYEGTSLLPSTIEFDDWNLHRVISDGKIAWVVITGMTKPSSGNSTVQGLVEFTLPNSITSKIYRLDGTSCDQAYTSNQYIAFSISNKINSQDVHLISSEAGKLKVQLEGSVTVGNTNKLIMDIRVPIFLDIGTIQQ